MDVDRREYQRKARGRGLVHWSRNAPFLLLGGERAAGRLFHQRPIVRRLEIPMPRLPKAWDGVTITHLTDPHFGPLFTPEHHWPAVEKLCAELASDLIVITGDWIDRRNRDLAHALSALRRLRAPLGIYGSLGNHDYFDNKRDIVLMLRDWLGPNLLRGDTAVLERDGAPLALIGLDYKYRKGQFHRQLRQALARRPEGAFTVCLAHDPHLFDHLKPSEADLILSGHTHGGQISLTAQPHRVIGPAMRRFRYFRGLYRRGPQALFISVGLGQSYPIRLNNPPEVAHLTLRRGEPSVR